MRANTGTFLRAFFAVFVAGALLGAPVAAFADGDGSSSGSVSSSDSAATSSDKKDVSKTKVATGDANGDTGDGDSSDDADVSIDGAGNAIDEGQVSDDSFLYDAAIGDLAGADSYYDKQTVQITGEVVGEAIAVSGDADHAWIVLRDESSGATVTVLMRTSDLRKIDTYGAYGKTGTTLRVRGQFNLACSQHEGESEVHAQVVSVQASGSIHEDEFDPCSFVPGAAALVVGGVCAFVYWRMRERSR